MGVLSLVERRTHTCGERSLSSRPFIHRPSSHFPPLVHMHMEPRLHLPQLRLERCGLPRRLSRPRSSQTNPQTRSPSTRLYALSPIACCCTTITAFPHHIASRRFLYYYYIMYLSTPHPPVPSSPSLYCNNTPSTPSFTYSISSFAMFFFPHCQHTVLYM